MQKYLVIARIILKYKNKATVSDLHILHTYANTHRQFLKNEPNQLKVEKKFLINDVGGVVALSENIISGARKNRSPS